MGHFEIEYYPQDFRKVPGIYAKSSEIGIFIPGFRDSFGIFYLRDRDFFRGIEYPDKKPTLISRKGHLENLVTRRTWNRSLRKKNIKSDILFKKYLSESICQMS